MTTFSYIPCGLLCLVLTVCILSKTVSGESSLGNFATDTVKATCLKLLKEGEFARNLSKQDTLPVIALLHNIEALTLVKCAKKLANEYSLPVSPDVLDMLQDLQDETDIIIANIID
jgi:hypothetical protein